MRRLTWADYREMPWANGRGTTVEILREADAEGLRLRLSMANVVEDGPFSALPGIDRVLVLLDGPGFTLTVDGAAHTVVPLSPLRFSGDAAAAAQGVTAPSRDFNVMSRRGGPSPAVCVLHAGEAISAARTLVFALGAGEVEAEGQEVRLAARDLLDAAGQVRLVSGGPAIAVGLTGA